MRSNYLRPSYLNFNRSIPITYIVLGMSIFFLQCSTDSNTDLTLNSKFIETNIDFNNQLHFDPEINIIEYLYYYNGGGVAIGDIDQDGLEDIYFTANQGPDKLFRNLGALKFEDISIQSEIIQDSTWSSGVSMDDVNQDGLLDIYVCKVDLNSDKAVHNLLYINQGDGRFIESAEAYGLDFSGYATQVSFFDMDLDGDLDVYLLNHTEHSTNSYGSTDKRLIQDSKSGDRLFENTGKSNQFRFVDVTENAGIYSSALGYGLAVITTDINDDGFPDIYVGNDFHENDYLYINQGNNTFKESIAEWVDHTSQFTMGVDAADINQDGKLDLFTTDMMPQNPMIKLKSGGNDSEVIANIKKDFGFHKQYARNHLLVNDCRHQFTDRAYISGTFATDWSWSPLVQDFNNDGVSDIFISNGIVKRPNDLDYINFINTPNNRQLPNESVGEYDQRLIDKMPTLTLHNIIFTQSEDLHFSNFTDSKVGTATFSNGAAYADLDQNGTLEIVSNNINAKATIISTMPDKNYISIALNSQDTHTTKGARIKVYSDGNFQMKEAVTTRGFQSSSTHRIHFGLADVELIDSVIVYWPDRSIQVIEDVKVNQHYDILKNGIENRNDEFQCITDSLFRLSSLAFRHRENAYNDFENEPLMPRSYTREGPAITFYDFDQDGYVDIYLGGARQQAAQLLMGDANYKFTVRSQEVFNKDAYYEDIDAAILDYNGDGHQDIYVVSGGNDKNQLDQSIQDRIYINDGEGNFKRLPLSLPHMNGSTVEIFDFNKDGYDDMFVGSQNVPGAYGVSPLSFILENVQGLGVRIAHKSNLGMVSSAAWTDVDLDGQEELLMAGEWMGVKALQFDGDTSFVSKDLDSFNLPTGMYRDISVHDVNSDAIPDIIIGNLGLNTQWRAGPVSLYLGDYDGNDFIDPIIFETYSGTTIPFDTKDALSKQIPTIRKAHSGYESFSRVTDIESLVKGDRSTLKSYTVDELASFMLMSDSSSYHKVLLPADAQLSPVNDILWMEDVYGGSLLVCANDRSGSHAMGISDGYAATLYTGLYQDTDDFSEVHHIPLPIGTVVKEAFRYDKQTIILATHNGPLYLLEL